MKANTANEETDVESSTLDLRPQTLRLYLQNVPNLSVKGSLVAVVAGILWYTFRSFFQLKF